MIDVKDEHGRAYHAKVLAIDREEERIKVMKLVYSAYAGCAFLIQ